MGVQTDLRAGHNGRCCSCGSFIVFNPQLNLFVNVNGPFGVQQIHNHQSNET